jgi:hypothetical protein
LPEEYRENPDGYFQQVDDWKRQAEEGQQYRTYGNEARSYIDWATGEIERLRRGQPASHGQPPPESQRSRWTPPPNPFEGIDWDDPAALPTKLTESWKTLVEQLQQSFDRHDLTAQQIEQRSQDFQNMFGYYDRINRLETTGLYDHVKYKPMVTRERVVEYMHQHPGSSEQDAWLILTEEARIEAARQAALQEGIEQGKREASREAGNRQSTTEVSRGTPPRRPEAPQNPHRGYGNYPQALYQHVEAWQERRHPRSSW